jgi:hypothetical protein
MFRFTPAPAATVLGKPVEALALRVLALTSGSGLDELGAFEADEASGYF